MREIYQLRIIPVFVLVFSTASILGQAAQIQKPATVNTASDYSLVIANEDGKQAKLTLADIAKIKLQPVTGNDDGTTATSKGYPLVEVLKLAGIEFGETLRGKRISAR